ncbi:hypothetical protein [Comamonas squillarum]|uniref:Uncharacterized protein n=1 Tax=Comamonas squillarum TaxID=2977320 RepID=A0ABY6A2W0_9BURK|nr:hypothetical protein [Comamonas sp. PR12]UXC20013.1 hypothetical protein N4T19_07875 [Comamonas sp. PR12]
MTEKIAYEKHPVSPERKAELRAQGFKIIDAQFKPAQAQEHSSEGEGEHSASKRGRKPSQAQE